MQLDEQVTSLKGEFETKKGLELELKAGLMKAEATLTSANSLLGKLGGEKNRWQDQVQWPIAHSAALSDEPAASITVAISSSQTLSGSRNVPWYRVFAFLSGIVTMQPAHCPWLTSSFKYSMLAP